MTLNTRWDIRNKTIHKDLGIPYVEKEITRFLNNCCKKFTEYPNNEVNQLNQPPTQRKWLKRQRL